MDDRTVFVPGTLPGEEVKAAGEGDRLTLVAVETAAESRDEPFPPFPPSSSSPRTRSASEPAVSTPRALSLSMANSSEADKERAGDRAIRASASGVSGDRSNRGESLLLLLLLLVSSLSAAAAARPALLLLLLPPFRAAAPVAAAAAATGEERNGKSSSSLLWLFLRSIAMEAPVAKDGGRRAGRCAFSSREAAEDDDEEEAAAEEEEAAEGGGRQQHRGRALG